MRFPFDEPAKADTLHASANQKAAGFDSFVGGRHKLSNVILSEIVTSHREATVQSKDPCPILSHAEPIREFSSKIARFVPEIPCSTIIAKCCKGSFDCSMRFALRIDASAQDDNL